MRGVGASPDVAQKASMEVTKIAEIEEKSTEAAVDFESVVAEDTEDVGPGQHLFGEPLEMYLLREPKLAVAFSGGCDSALLLAAAKLAGCEVHAYLVKTAFQPDFELDDARTVAAALEVPLTVVEADVLAQADICANPADRCYLCKRFIFGEVRRAAAADGFTVIVDGTNATVREIELLVQCGLSPMEAIKAATSTGAELCGLQDVTGTLKPGLMGDFIVVEGKPDENISDLRKLRLVAKHCRLIWSTLPNLNVRRFSVLAPGYEMKGGTFCDWRLI